VGCFYLCGESLTLLKSTCQNFVDCQCEMANGQLYSGVWISSMIACLSSLALSVQKEGVERNLMSAYYGRSPEESLPRPASRRAPQPRSIGNKMRRTPSTYGTAKSSAFSVQQGGNPAHRWHSQQSQKAVSANSEESADLIRAGTSSTHTPSPQSPMFERNPPSQTPGIARPLPRPASAGLQGAKHTRASAIPTPTTSARREATEATLGANSQPRPSSSAAGSAWPSSDTGGWGGERPGTAKQGERSLPVLLQAAHLGSDPVPSYWLSDHPDAAHLAKPVKGRGRSFVDTLAAAVRSGFSSPARTQKSPLEVWSGSGPAHIPGSSLDASSAAGEMLKGGSDPPPDRWDDVDTISPLPTLEDLLSCPFGQQPLTTELYSLDGGLGVRKGAKK